jgi:hypothetical protein
LRINLHQLAKTKVQSRDFTSLTHPEGYNIQSNPPTPNPLLPIHHLQSKNTRQRRRSPHTHVLHQLIAIRRTRVARRRRTRRHRRRRHTRCLIHDALHSGIRALVVALQVGGQRAEPRGGGFEGLQGADLGDLVGDGQAGGRGGDELCERGLRGGGAAELGGGDGGGERVDAGGDFGFDVVDLGGDLRDMSTGISHVERGWYAR